MSKQILLLTLLGPIIASHIGLFNQNLKEGACIAVRLNASYTSFIFQFYSREHNKSMEFTWMNGSSESHLAYTNEVVSCDGLDFSGTNHTNIYVEHDKNNGWKITDEKNWKCPINRAGIAVDYKPSQIGSIYLGEIDSKKIPENIELVAYCHQ